MQPSTNFPRQQLIRAETAQNVVSAMREAQTETERLLLELADRRRTSATGSITGSAAIDDAIELFLLARFELAVLMEDLASPRGSLRANFYARMLLLTVYESSLSLCGLLRLPLPEALDSGCAHLDLEAELRSVHTRVYRLAQRCAEEYGDIRDGVVAHRGQTAGRRMQLLEQISGLHVLDLALELSQAIAEFLDLCEAFSNPQTANRRLLPVAWQT